MNQYKKVFLSLINKGNEAAQAITDNDKRATAFAELANAVANSGLLHIEDEVSEAADPANTEEVVKEEKAKDKKKDKESIKKGSGKTKAKETKEVKQAPVPTPAEDEAIEAAETVEAEIVDEWTEEAEAEFQNELNDLNWYVENWTEDYVYNQCVAAFFEDSSIVGAEHIRPSNIVAFLTYLYELSKQAEQ